MKGSNQKAFEDMDVEELRREADLRNVLYENSPAEVRNIYAIQCESIQALIDKKLAESD
jgi:hypothetical protein